MSIYIIFFMKNPSLRFLLTISILLTFHSVTVFAMDPQEATNQITGCRLQVVGSNQGTDYREQLGNNRKEESLSENQIWQQADATTNYNNQVIGCRLQVVGCNQEIDCRVKNRLKETERNFPSNITTNYELPTTNCDNAERCHLTMNPEEISEAENAFGFSERKTARLEIPMEITTVIDSTIEGSACSSRSPLPSPSAVALSPTSIQPVGRL